MVVAAVDGSLVVMALVLIVVLLVMVVGSGVPVSVAATASCACGKASRTNSGLALQSPVSLIAATIRKEALICGRMFVVGLEADIR
jgi:hypothetical protein